MYKDARVPLPKKWLILLIPGMLVSSYLMFDIPYFIHDGFQCCQCPCPGDQGRLFTDASQRFWIGLGAMLNWWAISGFLIWAGWTGRWDPSKPKGQQWIGKPYANRERNE